MAGAVASPKCRRKYHQRIANSWFPLSYADTVSIVVRAKETIRVCYWARCGTPGLSIVSYHGRGQPHLMPSERIGHTNLRHGTGECDIFGQPVKINGVVLVESVYSFKDQSAPALILTEIDFEVLGDRAVRRLVVGATRDSMRQIPVLHETSVARLLERLV